MGNFTIFKMFENSRRGRQARNFTTNVPKILDLKSSSEQIFFRKLSLGAPGSFIYLDTDFVDILFRVLSMLPFSQTYLIRVFQKPHKLSKGFKK